MMRRFICGSSATLAAGLLAVLLAAAAQADVYNWNFDANGNWSAAGNWTSTPGDYPNSNTADAQILLDLTANRTITLTENIEVNAIRFNDTGGGTDMNAIIGPSSGFTLTFSGINPTIESATGANHGLDILSPVDVSDAGLTKTGSGVARLYRSITGGSGVDIIQSQGNLEISGQSPSFSGGFVVNSGAVLQARAFSGANVLGNTTGITTINGTGQFMTRDSSGQTISEPFVLNGIRTNGSIKCYAGGNNTINGPVTLNSDSSFSVADWTNNPTGSKRVFFIDSIIADGTGGPHNVYFLGDLSSTSAQGTEGRKSEMVLGAVSTYGGDTYLTTNKADDGTGTFSGNLRLGIDNPLPTGTKLTLGGSHTTAGGTLGTGAGSAKFALAGHNQELAGLLINGSGTQNRVVGNSATLSTLTLNIASGTNTYDGYLGWTDTDDNNLALVKTGDGVLELTAANTYEGTTTVTAGVLAITNPSALGSAAAGTTVANFASLEVSGGITCAEPVTLNGGGYPPATSWYGALRSTGGDNTWSGPITLATTSRIGCRTGNTFTLTGGITGNGSPQFVGTSSGGGSIIRIADTPINVTGGLYAIDNNVTLIDVGGNSWGGTTISYGGILRLGLDDAAPTSTVVTIGSGSTTGTLDLNGHNQTIAGLTDSGTGVHRVINSDGGTPTLTVNNSSPYTFAGILGIAGQESFGLAKSGAGTLTLTGANTYTGATTVSQGVLAIAHSSALGSTAGGTTVTTGVAKLELSGGINVAEPIAFTGGQANPESLRNVSGTNTLSGPITTASIRIIANGGSTLNITGGVTGSNPFFVVNAGGTIAFSGNPVNLGSGGHFWADSGGLTVLGVAGNTWGTTTFSNGTMRMDVANALPTTTNLRIGGISYGLDFSLLDLNGFSQTVGALGLVGTTPGPVDITSATPATMTVNQSATTTYNGGFTGAVGLVKSGTGTLNLSGVSAPTTNRHTGDTLVTGGALALGNVDLLQNSTLDTGPSGAQAVTFTVAGTNTYNLGGLQGADDLAIGGNTISVGANGQSTSYSGVISGPGGGLAKTGSGMLTLANTNTFSGATTITAGTLEVTGSIANSAVTVGPGAFLTGTGTTGPITVNGTVAPGTSPGILSTGTVLFNDGSTFAVELNGTTVGTEYDQLHMSDVTGSVALAGMLDASLGYEPSYFDKLFIIRNDGTDPVVGTFDGLDDHASLHLSHGGVDGLFWISYQGDWDDKTFTGGNDVVLMAVPEPTSLALLGLGGLALLRRRRRRA